MTTHFAEEPRPTGEIPFQEIQRARDLGARDLGARDLGARDLGARDLGARDLGARDLGGSGWGGSGSHGDRWRWLRRLWLAAGLLGLLVVWILLVMRWREVSHPLTIAIVGIMPVLAIGPLIIGILGAWWSRNWTLRVMAALTMVPFLYTTSPVNAVIGCRAHEDTTSAADDVFTIYTANVWFESPGGQPDEIAAAIAAQDPDILLLQEVTWDFLNALQVDPRLDQYAYRTTDIPGLPIEDIVWSRWPIETATVQGFANARFVQATVTTPTGPVTVSPIHLQAPVTRGDAEFWKAQHALLSEIDRNTPRILAGDFNATRDHQPFRKLLDTGWTDVHEVKGCGFDATWPVNLGIPAPIMRLDHVLVTDHFEVLDVRLGEPGGSDHLPVISTLRRKS